MTCCEGVESEQRVKEGHQNLCQRQNSDTEESNSTRLHGSGRRDIEDRCSHAKDMETTSVGLCGCHCSEVTQVTQAGEALLRLSEHAYTY